MELYIIIGGLIGIVLLVGGIIALNVDKKPKKSNIYKAKVLNCIISDEYIIGMPMECFDIVLEIELPAKKVRKEIKRRDPMDKGTTIEVYYNPNKKALRFVEEAFDEEKNYPFIFIAFGAVILFLMMAMVLVSKFSVGEMVFRFAFGYFAGVLFAFIGLFMSVIRPHKVNKDMIHCEQVEAKVVDVVRQGMTHRGDFGDHHRRSYTYSYLYEYEYGGVKRTVKGITSSNTISHAGIGKKAVVVINHKNGEVFCMDDIKMGLGMGIAFLVFGLGVIAVITAVLLKF